MCAEKELKSGSNKKGHELSSRGLQTKISLYSQLDVTCTLYRQERSCISSHSSYSSLLRRTNAHNIILMSLSVPVLSVTKRPNP